MLKISNKIALIASSALLVLNIAFVIWYIFIGYEAFFHSDSAVKVLLANEIYLTHDFFPDDWNYGNHDLLILFGHALIVPLISFMPAGFTSHAISGLIVFSLLLHSTWLITSLICSNKAQRILILSMVSAGLSGFMAENLFGQVSYGALIIIALYQVYLTVRYTSPANQDKKIFGFGIIILSLFVFWSNPSRAMIYFAIPFIASSTWLLLKEGDYKNSKHPQAMSLFITGMLIGTILHFLSLSGTNNVMGAGTPRWLSYELILRNISYTPKGILAIFGGAPTENVKIFSLTGFYEAIRLAIAAALMALLPYAALRSLKEKAPALQFMSVFTVSSFLTILFFQLTTTIPDMSDPVQSARYLIPSMFFALIIYFAATPKWEAAPLYNLVALAILMILSFTAYPNLKLSGTNSEKLWDTASTQQAINHRSEVIALLQRYNLKYGYATYWNAGIYSVLSNENTLIRQIQILDGIPTPMRWLSSNRWYRPDTWQGKTFLMLTHEESKLIDLKKISSFGLNINEILDIEGYRIFVFSENIAKKIPGWHSDYREEAIFKANQYSLKQTGELIKDHSGEGMTIVTEKGTSGALHFGPYINVEKGEYVVQFDVLSEHNDQGTIKIDVTSSSDQKIIAEKILTSSNSPAMLQFTINKPKILELRVWSLGNEKVIFKSVSIKSINKKSNDYQ